MKNSGILRKMDIPMVSITVEKPWPENLSPRAAIAFFRNDGSLTFNH